MSNETISKEDCLHVKSQFISKNKTEVAIDSYHVKYLKSVILFIKVELNKQVIQQSLPLLNAIIAQYAKVHNVGVGISCKTNIIKIIPGSQSIYIMTDEHHILPNIKLFYKYLYEARLIQNVSFESTLYYEAVHSAIQGLSINIYGKCATFNKKLALGNLKSKSDKITPQQSLIDGLDQGRIMQGSVAANPKYQQYAININTQDTYPKIMVAVILAEIPFYFKANSIIFQTEEDMEQAKKLLSDRRNNIVLLKRFIEQTKPVMKIEGNEQKYKDAQTRFGILAKIILALKGTGNPIGGNAAQEFILACKGRTNPVLTNLSKLK